MTSYNTDGKVGPWAQEKLRCLRDYLSAYTTILRKQKWCEGYSYIDAFAGAGRAELRSDQTQDQSAEELLFQVSAFGAQDADEKIYIEGSPRVALSIEHPFTRYVFVETDSQRAAELRRVAEEFSDRRNVAVIGRNASSAIGELLQDPSINSPKRRGVIFLDPFGMQVDWSTMASIAETKRFEVIVNLPVGMAIQRLLPRTGEFSSTQRERLNTYFGSAEWSDIVYESSDDLFGGEHVRKAADTGQRLAFWYRERLKRAFGFAAAPRLIRNSRGGHLYYLLFAGPNRTGAKIAEDILRQGEKLPRR